jgi:hypothetical protein
MFFVRVDLRALRARLSDGARTHGRGGQVQMTATNDDAFAWLCERGFHLGHGGWYANSTTLNRLHRTAIISAKRVNQP